ncbi:MAG: S8 family serine peptidase [Actinomycetota bacterium]
MPVSLGAPISLKRAVALLFILSIALTALPTAGAAPAQRLVSVIVQGFSPAAIEDAVESVGGTIEQPLPIVNGAAARVPEGSIGALESRAGIVQVTNDDKIAFQAAAATDTKRIQGTVNSDELWREGVDGHGVTVAILDTGIHASHPDLAGRVLHCEDLSGERTTAANCADTFGHGTFMAGLVAGNGASSSGKYTGAAPGANLVAIKAAGFDGSTDVSNVLAGIQWAVAFKDTYNIRVLNLSLGTDSSQDYRLSPLNFAVERAWQAGIVVVVSAGNTGPDSKTVMKPGDDPFVITVGSSSDMGTSTIGDDVVTGFSGRGPTRANGLAKPDVVSPGMRTISLRSPGSAIDQKYPSARVDANYFRGSGTSMSTATVSGVVAQMIQANPSLTPDEVKARLVGTAREIAETDPLKAGAGLVDAYAAASSQASQSQNFTLSTGLGSLALDRGTLNIDVQSAVGQVTLSGEFVANTSPEVTGLLGLVPWNGTNWTGTNWTGTNWTGTNWTGTNWTGTNWTGTNWTGTNWTGTNWTGTNWTNTDWTGTNWTGTNWTGTNWTATNWTSAWYAYAWD